MSKSRGAFIFAAIISSLILHGLLFGGILWVAPYFEIKKSEPIEISLYPEGQILEALTPKKQSIVRQALVPEKMKLPEDETLARYLSEQKQRVKVETKAAHSGMTANRSNTELATNKSAESGKKGTNILNKDGYAPVDISKELKEASRYDSGTSTVGESLPEEIKVGSFTALNTDRYMFYTFYARTESLIRYRWESRVQKAIDRFDYSTLKQIGNRDWITQVEFILDSKGFLKKALVMKESGIPFFDAAAVMAFQDAKVFPNPPKDMIQDDGFIHIKYSFTVNFNPYAIARE